MKRIFTIATLGIISIFGYTQDSAWEKMIIDENLTISFPGSITQIDTTLIKEGKKWRFKAYKYENEFSSLALIITPGETNMNVDNKETWKKALNELLKGALSSLSKKKFSCSSSDTTIDNIPCKKIACSNDDITMLHNYLFLVNDKMYSLQYAAVDQETALLERAQLDSFLNCVHFKQDAIKEMQFESKTFAYSYRVGYFIGMLIIPASIICVIVYFVRRRDKKNKNVA